MPFISFIITYHNTPVDMLRECLQSIMALSLAKDEREIIVVDDGSDICPINELAELADNIVYLRKRNEGLSIARNWGMDMAHGKYLQFVDDDDKLITANYERCLDVARYKEPDIVMFDFTDKDAADISIDDPTGPISGNELMLHQNIHATAWGYIFKKSCASQLTFTPGIYHEDEEFTPQLLLRAERVFVTSAKAYYYRQRSNSITSASHPRDVAKRLNDTRDVLFRLYGMCDKLPTNDSLALRRRVAQLTMDYIYNVIVQTRSSKHLENCIDELKDKGLFPLPNRNYTQKYTWFRRMTNSKIGRSILLATLPFIRK